MKAVLEKVITICKDFLIHKIFLIGAAICILFFIASNMGTLFDHVSCAVGKFQLPEIKAPAVNSVISEYHMSMPDLSLSKVTDFLGQPRRTLTMLREKIENTYVASEPVASPVSDTSQGIRLSDQLKGISGEDVKNAALGAACTYFGFWENLADSTNSDLTPIIDKLGEPQSYGDGYLSQYFLNNHTGDASSDSATSYTDSVAPANSDDSINMDSSTESESVTGTEY